MLLPNRLLSRGMVLVVIIFISAPAWAQTIDCRGTIQAWLSDPKYRAYAQTCTCTSNNSSPVCSGGSSGGSGQGHHKGLGMQGMMMQAIMAPMFSAMFASPPSGPSPAERAAAEQQRAEAEKQRQAAEKAKNEALQKWAKAQSDEEIRKQVEQQEKLKQGEKVLSQMQSVGGGAGKLEPFSFGNPKLELQPIDLGGFPTAHLSEFEKLMCSAFFSNMGKQSTSAVDAKFYADQAERTMGGQPTYIECRVQKASSEAMAAKTKAVKKIYEEANLKIQELDKIDTKLSEAKEKLVAATSKKDEAAAKVKDLEARAAETQPEQKDEVDDLVARAQKELEDAQKEAGDAQKAQQELSEKKSRIENDLNGMKSKIQAGLPSE